MTTNAVISRMTPLVSTPEVRLYTLPSTEIPRDQRTFRILIHEMPSSPHRARRFPVMHGYLRSIQYP